MCWTPMCNVLSEVPMELEGWCLPTKGLGEEFEHLYKSLNSWELLVLIKMESVWEYFYPFENLFFVIKFEKIPQNYEL